MNFSCVTVSHTESAQKFRNDIKRLATKPLVLFKNPEDCFGQSFLSQSLTFISGVTSGW